MRAGAGRSLPQGVADSDIYHGLLPPEDMADMLKADGDYLLHARITDQGKQVGAGTALGERELRPAFPRL